MPPDTNVPPASGGKPARSAIQRRAWFSAKIAPAPSIQLPAKMLDAPTTRSNNTELSVGAAGMKLHIRGWSSETHAGASTSA